MIKHDIGSLALSAIRLLCPWRVLSIAAFGGGELDPALMRGEIDGRATGPDTILQRNRDWIDKGLANIHPIMETPKGDKHPLLFSPSFPRSRPLPRTTASAKCSPCSGAFA